MSLQIQWTHIALQSLSEVSEYTFVKFGKRQLRKLSNRINSTTRYISFFPLLGKHEKVLSKQTGIEYHSIVVIKEIKLYYTINNGILFVEYIKNAKMDDNTMLAKINGSI